MITPQLLVTVTDSVAQQLGSASDNDSDPGQTLVVSASAPLHFGGSSAVSNTGANRGSLLPAGVYTFDVRGSSQLWAISPSGQTVAVEVLQVGI